LLNESLVEKRDLFEVIPNIVHDNFFAKPLRTTKNNTFVFINVCLFTFKKRIDLLIQAFAKGFKGNNSVRLHIGGDGEERQALERLVKDLGVIEQVRFVGRLSREQVVDEISAADAYVLSSQHETFGVVLIEALALGKPVIATRCGGPENIVTDRDGLLVPVDDVDALADAMQLLYANRTDYHADSLRQSCRERFSEEVVAQRLLGVYTEVSTLQKPDSETARSV
jgi:glycosyltransferase involved in cell wall biosynthesis